MTQNVYDLLWFFLFYSFLGWVIGTVAAAMRKHRFVDVGFLYGPWCPSYGIGGLMIAIFLQDLRNQLFFLFLGGAILSFLVSLATASSSADMSTFLTWLCGALQAWSASPL